MEDRRASPSAHELSNWITSQKLKLYAIGGRSNELIPLTLLEISAVPCLRSLQIADLTTLRPSHPLYRQFIARFGNDLSLVSLGVSEEQVRRLARTLTLRSRRRLKVDRSAGRPSKSKIIEEAVEAIVLAGEWSAEKPQKDLLARSIANKVVV